MADKCGGEVILPASDDEILALAHHLERQPESYMYAETGQTRGEHFQTQYYQKSSKVDLLM
jgi:hypothetical protein